MSDLSGKTDRAAELISKLLDGELSDLAADELRALLHESQSARGVYLRHAMMQAMLHWKFATVDSGQPDAEGTKLEAGEAKVGSPAGGKGGDKTSKPIVFGFLQGLGGAGTTFPLVFVLLIAIAAGLFALVASQTARHRPASGDQPVAIVESAPTKPTAEPIALSSDDRPARLTAGVDCQWSGGHESLRLGDTLGMGQSFKLTAGIAEITFELGARVVVQSPASFSVESAKSMRMEAGKLTAEITTAAARGFQVITPDATFVDQGTEFGVEVAPGGSSRIHVFKGEVDLAVNAKNGFALPTQRLLANSGARLEGDAPRVTFIEDTGDSFMRSLDDADRDLHVVAYWRFEDQPLGTLLPDTERNANPVRATSDSTFSGNDLFVWSPESRPSFSGDVPAAAIPHTGAVNHGCLDLTDPYRLNKTRPEVYTNSKFSHASPKDLQKISPAQWTVEASVKAKHLNLGRQTIVSRDAVPGQSARMVLRISDEDKFSVDFMDASQRHHAAASAEPVQENNWYNLAATSDGHTLRLFVDRRDARGYQLAAATELPADGSTALGVGGDDCSWAVGRVRLKKGTVGDALVGWIDEVRISDVAIDPAELLFAEQKATTGPAGEAPASPHLGPSGSADDE